MTEKSRPRRPQARHVFIRNLELLAHIGVYRHEEGRMQPVRFNVDLKVAGRSKGNDRLDDVVDYNAIATRIREIIAEGHVRLAETLAERILDACLEDRRVLAAKVRVEKLHALPSAESAGVEIERRR